MTDEHDAAAEPATFTGLSRRRSTPPSVRRAETIARFFITLGGIGTIIAVSLIFGFLLWVTLPLFASSSAESGQSVVLPPGADRPALVHAAVDGSQTMGWTLRADGALEVRELVTGVVLEARALFEAGETPTAIAFATDQSDNAAMPNVAFGFRDGTIRSGRIAFTTTYLEASEVPAGAASLAIGGALRHGEGMLTRTPKGQVRFDRLEVTLNAPVAVTSASIDRLDLSLTPSGAAYAFLTGDGALEISTFQGRYDMLQDGWVFDVVRKPLVYKPEVGREAPDFVRLSGIGNTLYLLWRDGHALRFDARDVMRAAGVDLGVVETFNVLPEGRGERTVEAVTFLVGKTTLMVADSLGHLHAWFPTRPADAYARDGIVTARGHSLAPEGSAARVTSMVASKRSRLLATGHADGTVRLVHVTTEQQLAQVASQQAGAVQALAFAPKEDGLVAWSERAMERWAVDVGHPEATLRSLFTKVWYEGQAAPAHAWQSEGGSDDFEPKLGLVALIFGTLKATLYSMLIAVPIALLAAIFTTEFLVPRWRGPIKSVIEMMASLPSVVLGFLAAIVLAPFVKDTLIVVLLTIVTLPFSIVLGASLWQLLPTRVAVRWEGAPRLAAVAVTLPAAVFLAMALAPSVEALCFGGDILGWLNRGEGSAAGGWSFLLLPICLLVVGAGVVYLGGPWLRRVSARWSRLQCALADLARFAVVVVGGVLLAGLLGAAFGGWDPRGPSGSELEYQPRNALIVGFVMGFAIVPIIYTLAEDALSSVPQELREGSLGCGATPWQTAWRIIVPTAASGLFGATMVGLGRAVGETMIVLMAAGNTAIMEWNAFNGFRTLSANIATELPEAVQGSTHYRVLFLAGLVLFAMTFVINTIAELVRRHFRKRFADL